MADNEDEIINGKKGPHIRIDPDGVEVWNGKRCENEEMTDKEQQDLEQLLKDFK